MGKWIYFSAGNRKKEEQLKKLCGMLGMAFVPVNGLQAGQQIGWLAGEKGFAEKKLALGALPPCIPEEVLLFSGMGDGQLDQALQLLRENGLGVGLKAVVTSHNQNWTLAQLYQELCRERAAYAGAQPRR